VWGKRPIAKPVLKCEGEGKKELCFCTNSGSGKVVGRKKKQKTKKKRNWGGSSFREQTCFNAIPRNKGGKKGART